MSTKMHQLTSNSVPPRWGGSVAEWLACWTQAQKARVQIAVATLSCNSLRRTVRTHCASVRQAATLAATLLRVAGANCRPGGKYRQPTAEFMTHVTCRLTARNRDQLRNPAIGNRVRASFTFTAEIKLESAPASRRRRRRKATSQ